VVSPVIVHLLIMASDPVLARDPLGETSEAKVSKKSFSQLEKIVGHESFLLTLENAMSAHPSKSVYGVTNVPETVATPEDELSSATTSSSEEEDDEFVVVEESDAVDSLAYYVAQCIVQSNPKVLTMTPQELQHAIQGSLQDLKKTRAQKLWKAGRMVYKWTALSYSALQMYHNPWLIRAILYALITFSRISWTLLR
jgi:hypothetical protein